MHCAFQDFENLYLVMDLLTGGDLRYHVCKLRRFSEIKTKFFIACLLLGLEYIHSNNIIHRDIKPENLVFDDKGYLRITDFGVAKIHKEDNSSETSGTPGYMAPEVLLSKNHSFPVDFFAIGIMGYEFMLGQRPYLGKNRKEIKYQVLMRQARIESDEIPEGWGHESVDFINKCLHRKDSRRLGYIGGVQDLKNHEWFNDFDWDSLYNKTLKEIHNNSILTHIPLIGILIGFILTYTIYRPGIYISCLFAILLWIIINRHIRRQSHGK